MGNKYKVGDVLDFKTNGYHMVVKIAEVKSAHYTLEVVEIGNCAGKVGDKHDYTHYDVNNSPYLSLIEQQKEVQKRFCSCEMLTLMRTGCACGGA